MQAGKLFKMGVLEADTGDGNTVFFL